MNPAVEIVFETHSPTEDNEAGRATGWLPGALSPRGRDEAHKLGERRRDDNIGVIFTSDLRRALETAELAFSSTAIPILHDWRLRECNYGQLNGSSAQQMHRLRASHIDRPYPGGESWRQAIERVGGFVRDLRTLYGPVRRVLVIGHVATRWGLEHAINGVAVDELVGAEFNWQEGWEYVLRLSTA